MRTKITQEDYPLMPGESWWIVNPNSGGSEFVLPLGASTACLLSLLDFKPGIVYSVHTDSDGWVCVTNKDHVVEMPQYLFARYFDAEVFVRGSRPRQTVTIPYTWVDGSLVKPPDDWTVTTAAAKLTFTDGNLK